MPGGLLTPFRQLQTHGAGAAQATTNKGSEQRTRLQRKPIQVRIRDSQGKSEGGPSGNETSDLTNSNSQLSYRACRQHCDLLTLSALGGAIRDMLLKAPGSH